MKPTHSTPCSASDSLANLNALASQNMQSLMNLASHSSDASSATPSGTTPQEPASFSGNSASIVQSSTFVMMPDWHYETRKKIKGTNRLMLDYINNYNTILFV
jgi:hypothetical protein